MNELMSRDPKYVPVTGIKSMQERLLRQGYLPPNYEPNGIWDPSTYAAFRRSDRDAREQVMSGKHWAAAPMEKFFQYLSYTVPSEVFQGVVGTAEGIVKQAADAVTNLPEVAQESGLLGGAAIGATAGAVVGGPVGALVGGGIGAGVGFFSDLFGEDEETEGEDRSFWSNVWDALSPYEEYRKTGAKHFFNALSTVMLASAALKGVGMIAGAGKPLAGKSFAQAFTRAAPGEVTPGILASVGKMAVKRPIVGSALIGGGIDSVPHLLVGDFETAAKDFARGAAIGAAVGPLAHRALPGKTRDALIKGLDAAPLRRIEMMPAIRAAREAYTGATTFSIAGRLFGGIGSGDEDTPVEAAIKEAPRLPSAVDWTVGLPLYPNRLLPWKVTEISESLRKAASGHPGIPFAEAARRLPDGKTVSFREGMDRALKVIGEDPRTGQYNPVLAATRMTFSYLQKGVSDDALLAIRGQKFDDVWAQEHALSKARSQTWRKIFKESAGRVEKGGVVTAESLVSKSPTAKRVYEQSVMDPHGMYDYIVSWEGRGTLIDNFAEHHKATEFLQAKSREAEFTITPALRDNPEAGITGYQTKQHFDRALEQYTEATQKVKAADEVADANPTMQAEAIKARTEYETVVDDLERRGMIEDFEAGRLRADPRFDNKIRKRLKRVGATRPEELPDATAALEQEGLGRYIGLKTGESVLFYDHVPKILEVSGVAEYTRRQGFFDLLSSLGTRIDDMDQLGRRRDAEISAQLDLVAEKHGLGTGKAVMRKIHSAMRERYDPERAMQKNIALSGFGPVITRTPVKGVGPPKRELFKIDPRDLTPEDLVEALRLEDSVEDAYVVANEIKEAIHVGAAFGGDAMKFPMHPVQQARLLGSGMKLTGLNGFNDFMRTAHVNFLQKAFPKRSYGYLPQNLHRVSMALRYSLSPSFDAGRYIEQASQGVLSSQIPVLASAMPRSFLANNKKGLITPYSNGQLVKGDELVQHAISFHDELISKRNVIQGYDEIQMRYLQKGLLGFKPREAEAAQLMWLYNRAAARGKISNSQLDEMRNTILEIGRYGRGRSPLGKSVHFVWFPFMFQAKLIRHLHDFVLGAPVRNLMLHEGLRRWNSVTESGETIGQKFSGFMEKHVPMARELARLNNLSFGLGPGRFFLEGLADKKTEGKVAQSLASFFVPGGAHQPLHELAGEMADLKHFFVPVVISGDTPVDKVDSTLARLLPIYRDIETFIFGEGLSDGAFFEQAKALPVVGEGTAPMWQMQEYLDAKRAMESSLEPIAAQLGYSSVAGLRSSEVGGPINQILRQVDNELGRDFPSGKEIAGRIQNKASAKSQVVYNIGLKEDRSQAEDAIFVIGQLEEQIRLVAEQANVAQRDILGALTPLIRGFAMQHSTDREFMSLWDSYFTFEYGPLRRVA